MQKILQVFKKLSSATRNEIRENKPVFLLIIFASFIVISLISAPVFVSNESLANADKEVLGESSSEKKPEPTPTEVLTPTTAPQVKKAVSTPIPTTITTPTAAPTATPTPQPSNNSNSNSNNNASQNQTPTATPTAAPTTTPSPTITPTPTVVNSEVTISINYGGQKENDTYTANINAGQNAWEVIKAAIGEQNLQYTDYGGELGIFITAFNGISAAGNQFYEFKVNGESSMIGVSFYGCNPGDNLEFVLTTF